MANNNQNKRIGSFAAINGGVIEGCSANVQLSGCPNGAGFVFGNSGVVKNSVAMRVGRGKGVTGFYKRNTGTINSCGYLADPKKRRIDRSGNVTVATGNPECFMPKGTPSDQLYHKLGLQNLWKNERTKRGFVLEPDRFRNRAVLFGTQDRVIPIKTAADLTRIITAVNSGDRAAASANYILEASINMRGAKLEPIGLSEALPFSGCFDGNGKTIYNFKIDCTGMEYGGFFGYTKNAKIANLTLDYVLKGKRGIVTGGMIGNAVGGGVSNCHVRVGMTVGSCAGGFVGKNTGYIQNCYVCGSVAGPVPVLPIVTSVAAVLLAATVTTSVIVVKKLTSGTVFSPEVIDPNQKPAPPEKDQPDPLPTGTSRLSLRLNQDVDVSYATGVGAINYVNPASSTHDMVIRLCISDTELKKAGIDLIAAGVRKQSETDAEGYDPDKALTTFYQSGRVQIGYQLENCKITALPGGDKLPVGEYKAVMVIEPYDPKTNEKSIVNAQAEITLRILNR